MQDTAVNERYDEIGAPLKDLGQIDVQELLHRHTTREPVEQSGTVALEHFLERAVVVKKSRH